MQAAAIGMIGSRFRRIFMHGVQLTTSAGEVNGCGIENDKKIIDRSSTYKCSSVHDLVIARG